MLIINGPNLNLLGSREVDIYGHVSFEKHFALLQDLFPRLDIEFKQTNHEGEIIDLLQAAEKQHNYVLLNAGGFTHTSVAIADCIAAVSIPVVEIHISHILARESFRAKSVIAAHCAGFISGFGMKSYNLGLSFVEMNLRDKIGFKK